MDKLVLSYNNAVALLSQYFASALSSPYFATLSVPTTYPAVALSA